MDAWKPVKTYGNRHKMSEAEVAEIYAEAYGEYEAE